MHGRNKFLSLPSLEVLFKSITQNLSLGLHYLGKKNSFTLQMRGGHRPVSSDTCVYQDLPAILNRENYKVLKIVSLYLFLLT